MAITGTIGASLNPLSGVTGASISSDHLIPDIAAWAEAIDPEETPIWTKCKKIGAHDQDKLEFGQSYRRRMEGTIAEALDATETAIDLTAATGTQGDINSLKKWNVIEVIDYAAGSTERLDYTTREEMLVDTLPTTTNTVTVKRGNNLGGTGVTHESGAYWAVCGTAMPYNKDFELSPTVRGDKLYNRFQRFYEMCESDIAARNTPTYEIKGDALLEDFKRATQRMKWEAERTLVSGQRVDGNAAAGDLALPPKMGGIDYFITNHSGRVTNLAGVTLSLYHLDDILRDQYKKTTAGGGTTMLMSIDTATMLDSMLNPARQGTLQDTSANLYLETIKFRLGQLEIMQTQHMPNGTILFVDFKDISIVPYKGCQWQDRVVPSNGPYDKLAIWGQYSVMIERVTRMAKLHNFNQDMAAYPRSEYF